MQRDGRRGRADVGAVASLCSPSRGGEDRAEVDPGAAVLFHPTVIGLLASPSERPRGGLRAGRGCPSHLRYLGTVRSVTVREDSRRCAVYCYQRTASTTVIAVRSRPPLVGRVAARATAADGVGGRLGVFAPPCFPARIRRETGRPRAHHR